MVVRVEGYFSTLLVFKYFSLCGLEPVICSTWREYGKREGNCFHDCTRKTIDICSWLPSSSFLEAKRQNKTKKQGAAEKDGVQESEGSPWLTAREEQRQFRLTSPRNHAC